MNQNVISDPHSAFRNPQFLFVVLLLALAMPLRAQGVPGSPAPGATSAAKVERPSLEPPEAAMNANESFMESGKWPEGQAPWMGSGWHRGMGGGGFGGGMGGGFGGGMPPGGRFRPPLHHWQDFETRLQECQAKFKDIEERRNKLLDRLASEKQRYQPDRYDPASVLAHQTMDKLLGDLHQVVEEKRSNTAEAAELVTTALMTRPIWESSLHGEPPPPEHGPGSVIPKPFKPERKQAWLDGLKRIDKEGTEGFAKALLTEPFAIEVMQSIPDRLRWPAPMGMRRGGGGGPMRRMMMDSMRQNLLARIERMEKQQEELTKEFDRQDRELHQMRTILENAMFEPGPPQGPPPGENGAKASAPEVNPGNKPEGKPAPAKAQ